MFSIIRKPLSHSRVLLDLLEAGKTRAQSCYSIQATTLLKHQPARHAATEQTAPKTNNTKDLISVTFSRADGSRVAVKVEEGKSLYDAVIDNNVDIDGFGACEGTLCCTTCHLIFSQADYEKVGEPNDEELDMLDLAYGLTDTSRLGCQVIMKKKLHPLEVQVPAGINDIRES